MTKCFGLDGTQKRPIDDELVPIGGRQSLEEIVVASRLANDRALRRVHDPSGGIRHGDRAAADERDLGGGEDRIPHFGARERPADAPAMNSELTQRRVGDREGIADVFGENRGQVGGAYTRGRDGLAAAPPQVHCLEGAYRNQDRRGETKHERFRPTLQRREQGRGGRTQDPDCSAGADEGGGMPAQPSGQRLTHTYTGSPHISSRNPE